MSMPISTNAPMQQFRKNSGMSWRQESVIIDSYETKTVVFLDSTPNMFLMQNPNNATLLIGLGNIPTATNYEFRVNGNSTKTFGRPSGTSQLYIMNTGGTPITVSLFSMQDDFDMSVLSSTDYDFSNTEMRFDGNINAINAPLPSGSNTIGKVGLISGTSNIGNVGLKAGAEVGVNALPQTLMNNLESIKSGIENGVNVISVPSIVTTKLDDIKTAVENNLPDSSLITKLDAILAAISNGGEVVENVAYEQVFKAQTYGWTMTPPSGSKFLVIDWLCNDGDADAGISNGMTYLMYIKPHEKITDMRISLAGLSGSVSIGGINGVSVSMRLSYHFE